MTHETILELVARSTHPTWRPPKRGGDLLALRDAIVEDDAIERAQIRIVDGTRLKRAQDRKTSLLFGDPFLGGCESSIPPICGTFHIGLRAAHLLLFGQREAGNDAAEKAGKAHLRRVPYA
jgi:hypothetical protein